ncbi:MAG TPA: UrcA family protein [Sphingomicrobium sp.]|nr:UrcA family protein [Sphingomicrobium sp.]
MKTALVTLCAAALLGGSASAEPVVVSSEQLPSERVSFADLNLSSAAGQAALKRRIRGAAERVCEFTADRRLDTYLVTHGCFVSAYRNGLRQMDTVVARRATGSTIAAASLTIRGE